MARRCLSLSGKLNCVDFAAEGMWHQMTMGSGATMQPGPYPERSGEPDCTYYLRTGLCRFGMSCRFNHPPDRNMVSCYLPQLLSCFVWHIHYRQGYLFFIHYVVFLMYIITTVKMNMQLALYGMLCIKCILLSELMQ